MDYGDLAEQVGQRRDSPIVVVANAGTTFTEAVDDLRRIRRLLDDLAIPAARRFLLVDAALAGIPLALLDPADRPGFDIADGADCVVVSGHKFLATPMPCAAVIVKNSTRGRAPMVSYTGALDATIASSRNGHAALAIWYALTVLGRDGLAARAEQCRDLAAYTQHRLTALEWPAWRRPHAMTVTLTTPPQPIRSRWGLADHHGRSHIVCAPGTRRADLDALLTALAAHHHGVPSADPPPTGPRPATNGRLPRQFRRNPSGTRR